MGRDRRGCYDPPMPLAKRKKSGAAVFRLRYHAPYDFAALLAFFAKRAVPGVELVDDKSYRRNFAMDGRAGRLRLAQSTNDSLRLTIEFPDKSRHAEIAAHARRMFDVDTDIAAVNKHLRADARLKKFIRRNPGQRVPGGWDVFEVAIRAVLGQQVSVAAARTLARRLVEQFGLKATSVDGEEIALFPSAENLADADVARIGLPRTRAATLNTIARAICDGRVSAIRDQSLDDFVASWTQLPGIGDWTAQYIAMRALSHPNAFPAADLILRQAFAQDGKLIPLRDLHAMAEAWKPWRAYAVLHVWRGQGE
jgi:AraC family transcriptional regulator of adaptative response / DNA-3-methyladenine glycosylase II